MTEREPLKRLYCYSNLAFMRVMSENDWRDDVPPGVAVISITGTADVQDRYGPRFADADRHWFPASTDRILNIEFDDITEDSMDIGNRQVAKGISLAQADEIVRFIERNKNCDFYIHCHAGVSRSQAVVLYILDFYKTDWVTLGSTAAHNSYVYRQLVIARRIMMETERESIVKI